MRALLLDPPEIAWTPELRWVLARAFGPADVPFCEPIDAALGFDLASRLNLVSRIGASVPNETLAREIGEADGRYRRARLSTAARNLMKLEAVRSVAALAAKEKIPFALLKDLALEALRIPLPGARRTGDLDLLLPRGRAHDFARLLKANGWRGLGYKDSEHHLDPLVHPRWGEIEVHRVVLGVRPVGSRRSFTFDTLDDQELLLPAPGLPENVRVPSRTVLVAHALVHGLVQHGRAPGSYPLFRIPADLQDLGATPEVLAEAGALLRDFDREDLSTLDAFVRALGSGLPSTLCAAAQSVDGRPDPVLLLIRHMVAGATDVSYGEGMKARRRFYLRVSDLPSPLVALRFLWTATFLTRGQIDAIYGPPRFRLGYLGRRLARPFDLVARYLRARKIRRGAWGQVLR